jgi:hypothetical protein
MDEEYADIYYVDTRNATRDHRPQQGRSPLPWVRPRTPVTPTRTLYVPPAPQQAYAQPAQFAQPMYTQAQPMIYSAPPPMGGAAALFGRLSTGQLIEMIAQVFAAVQSLPGAPVATRDLETDVANLILYQGASASHAKRHEQVRTLGSLVSKLVG